MKQYKKIYSILEIEDDEAYATGSCPYSINTYTTYYLHDNRVSPFLGNLIEGGVVIDRRPCLKKEDFIHTSLNAPLLAINFPNKSKQNTESEITTCNNVDDLNKNDYVSLDLYIEYWTKHGARIGKRVDETVVWGDGISEKIPKIENRFRC